MKATSRWLLCVLALICLEGCWDARNQHEKTLAASCDQGQNSACVELQSDLTSDRNRCSLAAMMAGNHCGSL